MGLTLAFSFAGRAGTRGTGHVAFGIFIGCDGRRPPLQAIHSPPRARKVVERRGNRISTTDYLADHGEVAVTFE
jgi:hypothetical protein